MRSFCSWERGFTHQYDLMIHHDVLELTAVPLSSRLKPILWLKCTNCCFYFEVCVLVIWSDYQLLNAYLIFSPVMMGVKYDVNPPFCPSIWTSTGQFAMNLWIEYDTQRMIPNLEPTGGIRYPINFGLSQNLLWLFLIPWGLTRRILVMHRKHTPELPSHAIYRSKCHSRLPWDLLSSIMLPRG